MRQILLNDFNWILAVRAADFIGNTPSRAIAAIPSSDIIPAAIWHFKMRSELVTPEWVQRSLCERLCGSWSVSCVRCYVLCESGAMGLAG